MALKIHLIESSKLRPRNVGSLSEEEERRGHVRSQEGGSTKQKIQQMNLIMENRKIPLESNLMVRKPSMTKILSRLIHPEMEGRKQKREILMIKPRTSQKNILIIRSQTILEKMQSLGKKANPSLHSIVQRLLLPEEKGG